jgi:hypothetical protein
VFEGIRQELAIFWIGGARATTRLHRDCRRAIPKPKFTLLLVLIVLIFFEFKRTRLFTLNSTS